MGWLASFFGLSNVTKGTAYNFGVLAINDSPIGCGRGRQGYGAVTLPNVYADWRWRAGCINERREMAATIRLESSCMVATSR